MFTHSARRRAIALGVAAVTAFALTACAPAGSTDTDTTSNGPSSGNSSTGDGSPDQSADSGQSSSESPSSTGNDSEATAPSGTIIVARTADIDKKDPHMGTAFTTLNTLGLVYETLVKTTDDGKLAPSLAKSWTVSDDGKTVTFDLQQGVTWQDGDPFTSADVTASLQRILDEKTGAVARSNLTSITKVEAPDDHTVVLHLSAPNAAILYALSATNTSIVHQADIEAGTVGTTPDGTGPYSWGSWEQGQQVTLTANPNYWGEPAKAATIEFRVIPSESSILSGLKAGAFQLGLLSDPSVAAQADGASGFTLVKQPSMSYHALMLNGRHKPLDNVKVRQAIACAIDRQEVIDTAAFGDGTVTGPITSPGYQYSPTEGLPCKPGDTDAAKKLLTESGVSTPITLKTIVMTDNYATAVAEAQNMQSQLKAIGVNLDLKQMPTSPYVKAWLAADYDAAVAMNGGDLDPYVMYGRYFTTKGSLTGPGGLTSQKLNDLLVQGNSTSDETQRQSIYQQLQQELLKESPWVWTFRGDNYYLVSDTLSGFNARADQELSSLATASVN